MPVKEVRTVGSGTRKPWTGLSHRGKYEVMETLAIKHFLIPLNTSQIPAPCLVDQESPCIHH